MNASLIEFLLDYYHRDPLGLLANLMQVLGPPLSVLGTLLGVIIWHYRHKAGELVAKHRRLEKEFIARGDELAAIEVQRDEFKARLPETVLKVAAKQESQGNYENANRALAKWVSEEGESLSKLFLERAKWAFVRAVEDFRPGALAVSEAYATASIAVWPLNRTAAKWIEEIRVIRQEEGHPSPDLRAALTALEDRAFEIFQTDVVQEAKSAEKEGNKLFLLGHYNTALPVVDHAITCWIRTVGRRASQTITALNLKVDILIGLGKADEALPIIRDVNENQAAYPTLGPNHPASLHSRYLLAKVLRELGKGEQALPIIRDVAEKWAVCPALDPNHPDTLYAGSLLVGVLRDLGKVEEALPIIRDTAEKQATHPAIGPDHPNTLHSHSLLAAVLHDLGKAEEALPIIRETAEKQAAHPTLGPNHPVTLNSRYLLAKMLGDIGMGEKALPIIREVAASQTAHPALGPTHPATLDSHYLLAKRLHDLGKAEEALPIIKDVVDNQTAHSTLGPDHPSTLRSRSLFAAVLRDIGKAKEALPIIRHAAEKQAAHPALGPSHPATLYSRSLLSAMLHDLGIVEETLPITATKGTESQRG